MFKEILEGADSLKILSNFSLVFFFILFIGIIVWVWRLDKNTVKYMAELPLDNDINNVSTNGGRTNG